MRTFNEGEELPNGKTKQYVITPNDGQPVGIAVIWNVESREVGPFYSFVMVTVEANRLIGMITDRMPSSGMMIGPSGWERIRCPLLN